MHNQTPHQICRRQPHTKTPDNTDSDMPQRHKSKQHLRSNNKHIKTTKTYNKQHNNIHNTTNEHRQRKRIHQRRDNRGQDTTQQRNNQKHTQRL